MKKLKRTLTGADMFHVPASLKAGPNANIKSGASGFVSLVLIGVFLYYFIQNIVDVVNYKKITFS